MDVLDVVILLFVSMAWFAVILFLTVILHELGHFIGGKLSGYKFAGFAILGYLYNGKRMSKYDRRMLNVGQCYMYTCDYGKNPVLLILGGCIMNMCLGVFFALITLFVVDFDNFTLRQIYLLLFLMIPSLINIIMGIGNLFFGSSTSDGKTFFECRTEAHQAEYNHIMGITKYLIDGVSFGLMPESLFNYGQDWKKNSLSAEMRMYCYYRELELADTLKEYISSAVEYGFNGESWKKGRFFIEENELEHVIYEVLVGRRVVKYPVSELDPRTYLPGLFLAEMGKIKDRKEPDTTKLPFMGISMSFEKFLRNGISFIKGED